MKNLPTNKNFGLVFSAFFLFIYFYIFLAKDLNLLILLFISVIFLILGVLNSIILKPLNILWYYIGIGISIIISPLILAFVFYIIVTPIGFIKRLFTKNYLDINYDRNKKSYWISCKKKPFYFKKQY
jgi:hypothetical protein